MKRILQIHGAACALIVALAVSLGGCATFEALTGVDITGVRERGRQTAGVVLDTYEMAQQGLIIYGSLPDCGTGAKYLCKDPAVWARLKANNHEITNAIVAAEPVLRGDIEDVGQLSDLELAVRTAKDSYSNVVATWKGAKP